MEILLALIFILLVFVLSGLKVINQYERGVVLTVKKATL